MAVTGVGKSRQAGWGRAIPAIVAVFLATQLHAVSHGAEFGSDLHHHDGLPCVLQLLCETGKSPGAQDPTALPLPERVASAAFLVPLGESHFPEPQYARLPIRGPPAFLS